MAKLPKIGAVEFDEEAIAKLFAEKDAVDAMNAMTAHAKEIAQAICPVTDGDHREAIYTEPAHIVKGKGAVGVFGSTSSTWHIVEYGTATNPAYRTLTQAAERAGFTFEPTAKGTSPL